MSIDVQGDQFVARIPFDDNWMIKGAPDRTWDRRHKVWVLPANMANAEYIKATFPNNALTKDAVRCVMNLVDQRAKMEAEHPFPTWYDFGEFQPRDHQREALNKAWNKETFALFHEMGLGKTFTAGHMAFAYYQCACINGLLVVCPSPIKDVWVRELTKFCPMDESMLSIHVVRAGGRQRYNNWKRELKTFQGLRVLVVGVESLSSGAARMLAQDFVHENQCMMAVDESSTIKNPGWVDKTGKVHGTRRTMQCIELGKNCSYRLIMTGTPVTQGMHDLYSQFEFLDWQIIGQKSFFAFRNRYCIMGGFEAKQIVGYNNIPEFMNRIAPFSHRALKKNCLDIPPKQFEERIVEPTKQQSEMTVALRKSLILEHAQDGEDRAVENALERQLRYQQIAGGLRPYVEGLHPQSKRPIWATEPLDVNPKLDALMFDISTLAQDTKVIIWARYMGEIDAILDALMSKYGAMSVLEFTGRVDDVLRKDNTTRFQDPDSMARFMVSNQQTGGMGQTWTAATVVMYYSNTFSYTDRYQSEDRAHRDGQKNTVTYIDYRVRLPVESQIRKALANKTSMAEFVSDRLQGIDEWEDWT